MVAKGAVVSVLLHRHDLHRIVSQFSNPRQHLLTKGCVAVDLGLGTAHAHVALIDPQSLRFLGSGIFEGVRCVSSGLSTGFPLLGRGIIDPVELNFVPFLQQLCFSLLSLSAEVGFAVSLLMLSSGQKRM